ncbi:unnamed protein product [Rhodiola kirilowii]
MALGECGVEPVWLLLGRSRLSCEHSSLLSGLSFTEAERRLKENGPILVVVAICCC